MLKKIIKKVKDFVCNCVYDFRAMIKTMRDEIIGAHLGGFLSSLILAGLFTVVLGTNAIGFAVLAAFYAACFVLGFWVTVLGKIVIENIRDAISGVSSSYNSIREAWSAGRDSFVMTSTSIN